jgi:hypothetical protein
VPGSQPHAVELRKPIVARLVLAGLHHGCGRAA